MHNCNIVHAFLIFYKVGCLCYYNSVVRYLL
nr:MAG TPA: hypothetical protein [Caudoviricetes sp.]